MPTDAPTLRSRVKTNRSQTLTSLIWITHFTTALILCNNLCWCIHKTEWLDPYSFGKRFDLGHLIILKKSIIELTKIDMISPTSQFHSYQCHLALACGRIHVTLCVWSIEYFRFFKSCVCSILHMHITMHVIVVPGLDDIDNCENVYFKGFWFVVEFQLLDCMTYCNFWNSQLHI